MTEGSAITEDLKKMLGVSQEPEVWEAEKGIIKRLAEAIGDPNPLYSDLEYAKNSRYGTIIGPPLYLIDPGLIKMADRLIEAECPLPAFINAGTELEYFKSIRLGDTITTVAKLVDLTEKEGRNGKLLFMTVEVTYTNQDNELVVKCTNNFVRR
jgi:acyl dehydratase